MIELREKYLEVQENEKFVKGDLFKLGWCDELDTTLSILLLVSGVFQYFHEVDIHKFIWDVKNRFSNVELIWCNQQVRNQIYKFLCKTDRKCFSDDAFQC